MTGVFYVPLRQHGVERTSNKSQLRKLTLEKKIMTLAIDCMLNIKNQSINQLINQSTSPSHFLFHPCSLTVFYACLYRENGRGKKKKKIADSFFFFFPTDNLRKECHELSLSSRLPADDLKTRYFLHTGDHSSLRQAWRESNFFCFCKAVSSTFGNDRFKAIFLL